VSFQIRCLLL